MNKSGQIVEASAENIQKAAALIKAGKLVAFPTETVYGLGGDARDERAIAAIYAAKGRPSFNPLIIHIGSLDDVRDLVVWTPVAQKLAEKFWPGPLTMVLPRSETSPVKILASAGLTTIALRFPSHPVAQQFLLATGIPVAAPSANSSGKLSTTEATHVAESLGNNVEMILDGGPCEVGVESTVIDLTSNQPTILRHGGVTKEDIVALLGPVRESLDDEDAPKSPGMLLSHYAPACPVRLNVMEASEDEGYLTFGDDRFVRGGKFRVNLSPSGNTTEAAANLFSMLHGMDKKDISGIAVMPIPMTGLGAAINDRLRRAAAPKTR